eukprot:2139333-Pyramimonas_sp.AAC.1
MGVENELCPIFQLEKPESAYRGRSEGPQHRYSTARGALARQQPAGATQSRAMRALQVRILDLQGRCQHASYAEHVRAWMRM